jgi:hypothetical protein
MAIPILWYMDHVYIISYICTCIYEFLYILQLGKCEGRYRVNLGKSPRSCSITGRRSGWWQKGHIAVAIGDKSKPCSQSAHFCKCNIECGKVSAKQVESSKLYGKGKAFTVLELATEGHFSIN